MKFLLGAFVKILSAFVGALPRRVQFFFGDILGFLWFDFFRIRRKVVLDNLEIAFPEKSLAERTQIGRESLHSMGRSMVEYLLMVRFNKKMLDDYFIFSGYENFEKSLAKGKGAFLLTLHLGNGDFGCTALAQRGLPVYLISKQFKSKWLNDAWFGLRRRQGTEFIREEKSSFDILKALKKNGVVAFVLDQYMGPPIGVKTKFFGKETGTAQGLALFALRTGADVIPGYTYRDEAGQTRVVVEEPIPMQEKGSPEETISFMTQVYTDKIEEIIRKKPGQWMWVHRRWKPFR